MAFLAVLSMGGGVVWSFAEPDDSRFSQSFTLGLSDAFSDLDYEAYVGISDSYVTLCISQDRSSIWGHSLRYPLFQSITLTAGGSVPLFLSDASRRSTAVGIIALHFTNGMQANQITKSRRHVDFVLDNFETVLGHQGVVQSRLALRNNFAFYTGKIICIATLTAIFVSSGFRATIWYVRVRKREWRRSRELCRYCGYSLRGLQATVCPECGDRVESDTIPEFDGRRVR